MSIVQTVLTVITPIVYIVTLRYSTPEVARIASDATADFAHSLKSSCPVLDCEPCLKKSVETSTLPFLIAAVAAVALSVSLSLWCCCHGTGSRSPIGGYAIYDGYVA